MIPEYPHKSPYAEAAKQLRDAIAMATIRDAVENLVASTHSFADAPPVPDLVSNGHATNTRDDIDALINEGGPRGRSVQRTHQRGGLT